METSIKSKRSESIAALAAALAAAQGQITMAAKDKVADTGKFSYKYATLDTIWESCRKPLADNGLSIVQIPTNDEIGFQLETLLLHSSGEWISGTMTLPINTGRMSELQAMGSAITYARRYMLGAMVGVTVGDDDDGQTAARAERNARQDTGRNGNTEAKPEEMNLTILLSQLRRIERLRKIYRMPKDILACRPDGTELPAPDDLEGWRVLFTDARDYALDEIERVNEETDELENEYPEIFGDPNN